MKALLLCNYEIFGAVMVTESINAIIDHSAMDIYVYSELVKNRGELNLIFDINEFDVIIVHYSIFLAIDAYCSTRTKAKLKVARGLKVAFLQDEYRFVDRSIEAMHEAGIGLVYSCVPAQSIPEVYPPERMKNIRVVNTLTGYASDYLATLTPKELKKRKYDVSYRGRKYPDWHGSMGREKFEIAEKFKHHARGNWLKLNISCEERDRVYGLEWVELIRDSRAVLGVESGASVFDFTGEISSRTETKRALLGKRGTSYDALRKSYFEADEGRIDLAQISPRVLEAICLRTACVLFEGSYSGLLSPHEHYIPLKKDFSNFSEVVKRLRDDHYIAEIVTNAYVKIAVNPACSYKAFVTSMDAEIRMQTIPLKNASSAGFASDNLGKGGAIRAFDVDVGLGNDKTEPQKLPRMRYFFMSSEQQSKHLFRESFNEAYPFTAYPYPHGLLFGGSRTNSKLRKIINFIKQALPTSLRLRLKSFLR